MKRRINIHILCFALAGLVPVASAQVAEQPAPVSVENMAGVYKERFMSATIAPGKAPMEADEPYQAENIVELVPVGTDKLYVRIHLDFYNGHSCGFYGVARREHGSFIYRGPDPASTALPRCVLSVSMDKGQLSISDRLEGKGSSCSAYCGARGSLNHTISMNKRRPIRYMERLKASRQYMAAIAEMHATQSRAGASE